MPLINLPTGTEIQKNPTANNSILIQVPYTHFFCKGKKNEKNLWDITLLNPEKGTERLIEKDMKTAAFSIFSSLFLNKQINI